jgi:rare lipoprotein A
MKWAGLPLVVMALASSPSWASPRCPMSGVASWYGPRHEGRPTASGEAFRSAGLTAASRCLKLGTMVEVRHRDLVVIVRINDRGPYVSQRILDLSRGAAERLGITGIGRVHLRLLGNQP